MSQPSWLIAVMGPTASGKSVVAETLAEELSAKLLNADAFHVYRGFDVGTNKPAEKDRYRLLDLKDPNELFGLGEWISFAQAELRASYAAGENVVVVGGTGLYIRALFEQWSYLSGAPDPELRETLCGDEERLGLASLAERLHILDPAAAEQIDLANPARVRRALERALSPASPIENQLPPFRKLKVGLVQSVDRLNACIDARSQHLLKAGWIEEVELLRDSGVRENFPAMRAIGYRTVLGLIEGALSANEAISEIQLLTRQYAKRQRTWLRSEPNLRRLDADGLLEGDFSTIIRQLEGFLSQAEKQINSNGKND